MTRPSAGFRLAWFVPGHAQTGDIVKRINDAAGAQIARAWFGLDQPDPDCPGQLMCRCAGAVAEVKRAGGKR